jgi:hypothetical protein
LIGDVCAGAIRDPPIERYEEASAWRGLPLMALGIERVSNLVEEDGLTDVRMLREGDSVELEFLPDEL